MSGREGLTICLSRRFLTVLEGGAVKGDGTMMLSDTSDRGTISPLETPTDMLLEKDPADTRAIPTPCPSGLTVFSSIYHTLLVELSVYSKLC